MATPPFLHQPPPPFQCYPPFLAKFLVTPQVTQFFEGPTPPPLIRGRGGSNYVYGAKIPLINWDVDVNNIIISKLVKIKTSSKHLIGCLDKVIRPLVLI